MNHPGLISAKQKVCSSPLALEFQKVIEPSDMGLLLKAYGLNDRTPLESEADLPLKRYFCYNQNEE
jgi:hypothetical protein